MGWWQRTCQSVWAIHFADINPRGIGQVMFQDNLLSGLYFFLAIGWGSYAAGAPEVAIGGLLAIVAASPTALWLRVDAAALNAPFVLIAWLLLSSNGFYGVPAGALPTSGLIQPIAAEAADPLRLLDFLEGLLIGVSQVFVKGDSIAALLILIGLAVGSVAAAGYALAAALISVIVTNMLGSDAANR